MWKKYKIKKNKTSLIVCFNNILTTSVLNFIRINAMLAVLSRFKQPYTLKKHRRPFNAWRWLLEIHNYKAPNSMYSKKNNKPSKWI